LVLLCVIWYDLDLLQLVSSAEDIELLLTVFSYSFLSFSEYVRLFIFYLFQHKKKKGFLEKR